MKSSTIPLKLRTAVYERDDWTCQRCRIYIPGSGLRWGLQHRRPRGMGGSKLLHTMANLVVLCGWSVDVGTCTHWVERADRPTATAEGWLVPHGAVPEEWPVLRYGREWFQPGELWAPSAPHPRQLELLGGTAA